MSARSAPWATALLVAVCAGLGAAVVLELSGAQSIAPPVTAASPLSPAPDWVHEPVVFQPPSRGLLNVIAARPLFSPSRRPFVAVNAHEALPGAATALPPLELIGILLTEQRRAALIRPMDGGAPGWVREDEAVAGWQLERIEQSRVHLRAGERVEVVQLRADTAAPPEARSKRRKVDTEQRRVGDSQHEKPRAGASQHAERVPDAAAGEQQTGADAGEPASD